MDFKLHFHKHNTTLIKLYSLFSLTKKDIIWFRRSLRYGLLDALKSLKELQHKSLSAKKSQENRRRSWKSFGPGQSGQGRVWV